MTEIIESNKILKVYPSFILGKCRCGCNQECSLRDTNGMLRRYIANHHGKKMEDNYFWQGGVRIDKDNYVLVKKHGHPNADGQGYIRLHRLIMSEHLGRPLEKDEEIHHIDGNTFNNDLSNLQLIDHSSHSSISATKDHGDRNCFECGIDKTTMKKDSKTGKYYPYWIKIENKWFCRKCGRRRNKKEGKKV
jgi:hypothetical protein